MNSIVSATVYAYYTYWTGSNISYRINGRNRKKFFWFFQTVSITSCTEHQVNIGGKPCTNLYHWQCDYLFNCKSYPVFSDRNKFLNIVLCGAGQRWCLESPLLEIAGASGAWGRLSWWNWAWMAAIKDLSSSLVCFLALVCYSEALRVFGCEILALIFFPQGRSHCLFAFGILLKLDFEPQIQALV